MTIQKLEAISANVARLSDEMENIQERNTPAEKKLIKRLTKEVLKLNAGLHARAKMLAKRR